MHPVQSRASFRWSSLVAVTACWSGCTATPLPEPPAFAPDLTRIAPGETREVGPQVERASYVDFVGEAGAADPSSTVRVTNLDTDDESVAAQVQEDGSFAIAVMVKIGNELRFESVRGGVRSAPSDGVVGSEFLLQSSPRFECVRLLTGNSLDFGETAPGSESARSWTARNECATEITAANPTWRLDRLGFSVEFTSAVVPAGGEFTIPIKFSPAASGNAEDVLFVDLELGDERIRYPVTVYGRAP